MSFLSLIPLKAWLIAGGVAALGFVLWHDHWMSGKYKAAHAEVAQVTATLTAERANRKIEQDDRRRADESVKSLEAQLASINAAPKPPSVFCRSARVSAASESGTAASASSAATADGSESSLRDVGALLDAVRIEQQSNAARQRALIEWELARTH